MDELDELKKLAGLDYYARGSKNVQWQEWTGSNPSITAHEKAQLMKTKNIKPGTPEWFQLWFSRPYLTNEPPVRSDTDPPPHANQK